MKKLFFSPRIVLFLLSILTLSVVVWFYPGNVATGDAGYKYLEARDLLLHGPADLSCIYPGRDVDPDMKYIPFQEPFVYLIQGSCYYVFPFQLAFLYAPFYFIGGIYGIYAIAKMDSPYFLVGIVAIFVIIFAIFTFQLKL